MNSFVPLSSAMSADMMQYTLPNFTSGKTAAQSANPYLACLIDPANSAVRIPDEYSNQTALYCSRSFFDVYGNNNVGSGTDIGKFSFYIRPVIGTLPPYGQLTSQVMYYLPTTVWPSSWNFDLPGQHGVVQDVNLSQLIGATGKNGLVKEIRPVAMSAWFQYTAPSITLGGHVACALTDGNCYDFIHDSSLNPTAGLPLQEYRMLSTLPNSYNGKITDGCYAFYKPYDVEDCIFQSAHQPYDSTQDYGCRHTYPSICISGQVISTGAVYTGPIGRIQVDIVFEYVTFSRIVESIPSPVNPYLVWNARQALQNAKSCMANDEHESFIHKALAFGKSLLAKTAPAIGTAVGTLLGGPAGGVSGRRLGQSVSKMLGPTTTTVVKSKSKPTQQKTKPRKKKTSRKRIQA